MPEPNDKFRVEIGSSRLKRSDYIISWLPEELDMSVDSEWTTPLAGSASTELGALASIANLSLVSQWMTVAVWSGSSPITMTLPLQFIAENEGEASTKVLAPIRRLMELALPRFAGSKDSLSGNFGVLTPPGPNPGGQSVEDFKKSLGWGLDSENITVKLGNFIRLTRVVVLRVNPIFSTLLDKNGLPMKANVSFTFRTSHSPVKDDMLGILNSNVRSL